VDFGVINRPCNPYLCRMTVTTVDEMRSRLGVLYQNWAGKRAADILLLPKAGSDRHYFRLGKPGPTVVGVYNSDHKENEAFVYFSRHFHGLGLPVPQVFAHDLENGIYIQEDLGDLPLLGMLEAQRTDGNLPRSVLEVYEKSLRQLALLHIRGHEGLDYGKCFARPTFDTQSMAWDLAYFKYYFLKLAKVHFDEQLLEDDFVSLARYLDTAPLKGFMHRDFQARNIMVRDHEPFFIDFQGGRFGAVQYDLASLLYQAKAGIPAQTREHLLNVYLEALKKLVPVDESVFKEYFRGFVLIRTLQVLGAYGFRGLYEGRRHFLESIPAALDNLREWLGSGPLPVAIPHLRQILQQVVEDKNVAKWGQKPEKAGGVTVTVSSFSFKEGIPTDPSGNGGGFVFDCRGILNPGRFPTYKSQTGRDKPVIDFLLQNTQVEDFLRHAFAMVEATVEDYARRGFTHLMVSFGCTGGQHRSVFCADQMAHHLKDKLGAQVVLNHVVQDRKNWRNEP